MHDPYDVQTLRARCRRLLVRGSAEMARSIERDPQRRHTPRVLDRRKRADRAAREIDYLAYLIAKRRYSRVSRARYARVCQELPGLRPEVALGGLYAAYLTLTRPTPSLPVSRNVDRKPSCPR